MQRSPLHGAGRRPFYSISINNNQQKKNNKKKSAVDLLCVCERVFVLWPLKVTWKQIFIMPKTLDWITDVARSATIVIVDDLIYLFDNEVINI